MGKFGIHTLVALSAVGLAGAAVAQDNFNAHLNGEGQVPPFDTTAQGQFIARSSNGDLSYRLIVASLANIVAAHIHCAPAGVNGPVGVTLFAGSPVTLSGTLAAGPILAPDASNGCGRQKPNTATPTVSALMIPANFMVLIRPKNEE